MTNVAGPRQAERHRGAQAEEEGEHSGEEPTQVFEVDAKKINSAWLELQALVDKFIDGEDVEDAEIGDSRGEDEADAEWENSSKSPPTVASEEQESEHELEQQVPNANAEESGEFSELSGEEECEESFHSENEEEAAAHAGENQDIQPPEKRATPGNLPAGLDEGKLEGARILADIQEQKARQKAKLERSRTRVIFPALLWRGQDILVINKPADWICSASDVDLRKGRKLDPNEKVRVKGFETLADLENYKFGEREKKYIHWWIQLEHHLDDETYGNLFDEEQNYGLCHRLDRETSGTVLVGLTRLARTQMRECFHRHYVRKLYVCLVHGIVTPVEQTIDRQLEALGQKARLHKNGKRARTHVKVLGTFTRTTEGQTHSYSLCTCEIAEGRMHQIRLHMSSAIECPIVSEIYYQDHRQMVEDRRWLHRIFLHAYAVGFPDVSGENRRVGAGVVNEDTGLLDDETRLDTEQEWHCCICPLTQELREALSDLTPIDDQSAKLRECVTTTGLLDAEHDAVHVMGTTLRKEHIDDVFFPWSSQVNPIEMGDLSKPRESWDAIAPPKRNTGPPPDNRRRFEQRNFNPGPKRHRFGGFNRRGPPPPRRSRSVHRPLPLVAPLRKGPRVRLHGRHRRRSRTPYMRGRQPLHDDDCEADDDMGEGRARSGLRPPLRSRGSRRGNGEPPPRRARLLRGRNEGHFVPRRTGKRARPRDDSEDEGLSGRPMRH
mmetsp:Transcript_67287/g.161301  ORF Transcript_67287/g.161301 Transcript_67287/m.161301 type:complete len:722 (-) Transcript_67287:157-2322(-)